MYPTLNYVHPVQSMLSVLVSMLVEVSSETRRGCRRRRIGRQGLVEGLQFRTFLQHVSVNFGKHYESLKNQVLRQKWGTCMQ